LRELSELLAEPALSAELTREEKAAVLVQLSALQAALAAGLADSLGRTPAEATPVGEDSLLTALEVAARFGRSVEWVYRKAQSSQWRSFTIREGAKTLRFSERGLRVHLAAMRRRGAS
jgi:hypothetical protein